MSTENETVPVRRDDLELLLKVAACYVPYPPTDDIREVTERAMAALRRPDSDDEEQPLPEGIFGRVELPGWRNHTGWITDELRYGIQMAVVRDRAGAVLAEVALGPGCQIIRLAPPLPDGAPRAALAAGGQDRYEDDDEYGPDPF